MKFIKILAVSFLWVFLSACGGGGGDSTPVATTPSIGFISAQATNQSVKKAVSITVANFPGATLSYTIASNPSGKVSGSVSGSTLTLTPLVSHSGTVAVTLTASDGSTTPATTAARTFNLVITANDPLYKYQWHLDNTGGTDSKNFSSAAGTLGKDINVDGVIIDGYDGTGVIVAIVDEGLDIDHPDLAPNVVSNGSWDYRDSDNDPTQDGTTGDHGTSVAGLTAAAGWNGKGGRGVAPAASLKGFNWLESQATANWVSAHGGSTKSADADIFNMSYGGSSYYDSPINSQWLTQMEASVTNLRSNKGAIFVKSSGNSHYRLGANYCSNSAFYNADVKTSCSNAGATGMNSSPYNVLVGALGATGVKSSYSSAGSAVWVSAPGGEYGSSTPAMMTTDDGGCSRGYVHNNTSSSNGFNNSSGGSPHSLNALCNYTATFNGTSSAAPVTSGVVALMLDANPALTWRDVKHILATTSTQVDASKANLTHTIGGVAYVTEPAWLTNGAGHKFHNWYGFGGVNVGAAVTAALSYTAGSLGSLNTTSWQSSGTINASIPNATAAGVTNAIAVSASEVIEAVQLKMNVTHTFTGCLGVELVSPAGTKSVLVHPYNMHWNTDDWDNFILLTNAFYGESTNGNWTVRVLDGCTNGFSGASGAVLEDWSIRFFEH